MNAHHEAHYIIKAIKDRWPIPEAKRIELMEKLQDIALGADPTISNRTRVQATKVLLDADKVNIQLMQAASDDQLERERLDTLEALRAGICGQVGSTPTENVPQRPLLPAPANIDGLDGILDEIAPIQDMNVEK